MKNMLIGLRIYATCRPSFGDSIPFYILRIILYFTDDGFYILRMMDVAESKQFNTFKYDVTVFNQTKQSCCTISTKLLRSSQNTYS